MSDLYVYLIRSRNKDNKNVPNFKERAKTILEYKENEEKVFDEFYKFAADGVLGEQTRLYRSVNSRNEEKIRKELIVRLLRDKPSTTKLNRTLASVAQQVENRDESKWLFDFDVDDELLMYDFVHDVIIFSRIPLSDIQAYTTPHGYAIVVPHGFDTRELMERWKDYDISIHKDRLLFLDMITKESRWSELTFEERIREHCLRSDMVYERILSSPGGKDLYVLYPSELENEQILKDNIPKMLNVIKKYISESELYGYYMSRIDKLQFDSQKIAMINEARSHQEKADELAEIMNEGISPYAWYYYDAMQYGYVVYLDKI